MPNRGNILIVDDTPANLRLLASMLGERGYKVRPANNGMMALGAVHASAPDLVLLDVRMPGMDGYQVCRQLKADEQTRDIPIIFISALDEVEDKVKGFAAGGVDYVTKPFQFDEVLARIETHLALRNMQKKLEEQNVQLQREIGDRVRVEKVLRRRNLELALLNRVGRELAVTLDLQQVTEQLLEEVTDIIGAQGASVWLWDVREPQLNDVKEACLVCQAFFHHEQDRFSLVNTRLRPGQGVAGWVAQNGQSVIVSDTTHDARFFPGVDRQTGVHTTALIAVPLQARGKVIGVLEVVNKLSGNFDVGDLVLVETLAASAAIAIDNARLVEALRQRTVELEARNKELDAFSHTVAHDLKAPVSLMLGFAQVLEEDHTALPDEELRRHLHTIASSGRKMINIIDELLLLAGVREMEEVEMTPLDMAAIVAETQRRLADLIEEHQAEIILPSNGEWPVALGYGPWVEEVWVNYLSNAIKYGGRPAQVELGATAQADGTVRFWVRDNGPGLTLEQRRQLFTPFERLHNVRAKGHGLGLSIVQRIIKKLGGQVGVQSPKSPGTSDSVEDEGGQGSIFYFTLPGTAIPT